MIDKQWSLLSEDCPIDISRIHVHCSAFESNIPNKITLDTLNSAKEAVLSARSNLNSMVTTLVQTLYDRNILKTSEDKILYAWLVDNFGRYLKRLDDDEFNLIIKLDEPDKERSGVGISRISAYSKLLVTSSDNLIYEPLLKATEEYKNFKETTKMKKEPRIFLYILFQILQVTLSVLGGLSREKTGNKKTIINQIPTSYQGLMSKQGGKLIKEGYKQDTGIDITNLDKDLEDLEIDLDDEDDEDNTSDK